MSQLEIIVIIMGRVDTFVHFIIRHRVKHLTVYPSPVFSMYHLAHEPEVRLHLLSQKAQLSHKLKIQHIGAV